MYEDVAYQAGLRGRLFNLYVAYMRARWGGEIGETTQCKSGYALEWAERFKNGEEYLRSDCDGQRLLDKLYNEIRF
jgi:hypothetical protein